MRFARFIVLLIFVTTVCQAGWATNFYPTFVYKGYVKTNTKQLPVKFSYQLFTDSTFVGSYFYKPQFGVLRLEGKLGSNNKFRLAEKDETGKVTGYFTGKLSANKHTMDGIWTDAGGKKSYPFLLNWVADSRWHMDYIWKYRELPEYHDIRSAIKHANDVVAFDIASQNHSYLPGNFAGLKHVVSINLLGNNFTQFPTVISKLTQLEELSMSSNRIRYVSPKIGKLKKLKVLIINFNELTKVPEEIGQLDNLLYLELGRNHLTDLPVSIANLQQLQELHIDGNQLTENAKRRIKKLLPNCLIFF